MISIRRSRTIVLPVLLFSLICLTFNRHLRWLYHPFTSASNSKSADDVPSSPFHPGLVEFWDATSRALVLAKPDCSLPTDPIQAPLNEFASLNKSFDFRPDLLDIPQRDVDIMRDAHARFVSRIPELAQKLPYAKGTQGIVVAASDALLPVFLVSLKMLRRTGSILPVEVFMETKKQYEREICEIVLPPMNATCMILSEILEAVPEKLEMSRYQLKSLALALSSFEDVLLLDADNIPIEQPEHLLNSEPFSSTGFVSWPDYWANTASPKYYTISSQPIPPTSSRAASEAGQLLLSKRTHAPTVLLILYYNHHGPTHYYKLLSQSPAPAVNSTTTKGGSPDREREPDTDKETYLAAAASLNATVYTVTTPIHTLGYTQAHDGRFIAAGLVQHNPTDDYYNNNNSNNRHAPPLVPPNQTHQSPSSPTMHPSFLHANVYKPDAASLYDVFNDRLRSQRMWGARAETLARFGGRDVEKQVWAETLYTGCHLQGAFGAWRNRTENVCGRIGKVYKFLFN